MIFAKVDVELRDHERAARAGSAMGTWLWCLLWSRAKLRDGFVSHESIRGAFVGDSQARRDMGRLVSVGLASVCDGGWMIVGYEAKNETRADVERRQEDQRVRKARSRETWERKRAEMSRATVGDVTRDQHVTPATVTGTREPEPEPEPEPDLRERAHARARSKENAKIHPSGDLSLAPWAAASVATAALATGRKLSPEDLPGVWAQFVGHLTAENRAITPAEWLRWITRELRKPPQKAAAGHRMGRSALLQGNAGSDLGIVETAVSE